MTHFVIQAALLAGFVVLAMLRRKPRAAAPASLPSAGPGPRLGTTFRRAPPGAESLAPSAPLAAPDDSAALAARPYLIVNPHPGAATDRMASAMAMMSGPGLCTPPNP